MSVDCVVRNVSDVGARLNQVATFHRFAPLPDHFEADHEVVQHEDPVEFGSPDALLNGRQHSVGIDRAEATGL